MILDRFNLSGKVVIITGGAGLMGSQIVSALKEVNAIPIIWDIEATPSVDITIKKQVEVAFSQVIDNHQKADVLINNAAIDPKVDDSDTNDWTQFENYDLNLWHKEVAVGLTGALICSQIVGSHMSKNQGGVILNIASDLSVISPDQRLYDNGFVKPVSYSVIKHGLIGLTKYLSTYWAKKNIRVNAISPGGIYNNHDDAFVHRLTNLIPMARMAQKDEYQAAILFLISEASSYMTGQNLVIDGGRTVL